MRPVWEQKRDTARVTIPPENMLMQWESEIALPQHVVWDYLTDPVFRIHLGADSVTPQNPQRGRMGEGSRYQCYHGKQQLIQTILEWQPFEHEISEDLIAPNTYLLMDFRL